MLVVLIYKSACNDIIPTCLLCWSEVESSRTSLASRTSSRTDFEVLGLGLEGQVLGLGLEASSPRKLACPRLEDSTIFWKVKILWSGWKIFWKARFFVEIAWKIFVKTFFFFFFFFFWRSPEKFLWRPFFFFLESTCALCPWSLALASSIPVLGLESVCPRKGCPWPWPWPRIFFVSLALASSLVSSTPPLVLIYKSTCNTCLLCWYLNLHAEICIKNIDCNFTTRHLLQFVNVDIAKSSRKAALRTCNFTIRTLRA